MTETETFRSSRTAAHRENLGTAASAALLTPAFLYFARGERDPLLLTIFAALAGVASFAFYSWRARRLGRQVVEIGGRSVRFENRRGSREVDWSEIRRIHHSYVGGERWTLVPRSGKALVLALEGFSGEQCARIGELIRAGYAASRSHPGAEPSARDTA